MPSAGINVTVQFIGLDGFPLWSYVHSEVVVMERDAQASGLRALAALTTRIDEARAAVIAQARRDVKHLPAEQEAFEKALAEAKVVG